MSRPLLLQNIAGTQTMNAAQPSPAQILLQHQTRRAQGPSPAQSLLRQQLPRSQAPQESQQQRQSSRQTKPPVTQNTRKEGGSKESDHPRWATLLGLLEETLVHPMTMFLSGGSHGRNHCRQCSRKDGAKEKREAEDGRASEGDKESKGEAAEWDDKEEM